MCVCACAAMGVGVSGQVNRWGMQIFLYQVCFCLATMFYAHMLLQFIDAFYSKCIVITVDYSSTDSCVCYAGRFQCRHCFRRDWRPWVSAFPLAAAPNNRCLRALPCSMWLHRCCCSSQCQAKYCYIILFLMCLPMLSVDTERSGKNEIAYYSSDKLSIGETKSLRGSLHPEFMRY